MIADSSANRLQIADRYIMEYANAIFVEITAIFVTMSGIMHATQIVVAQCITTRTGNICGK